MKRSQPQPPHTGGTFRRRLQPLYTEKHKVSCSGFLPNTSPMQHSSSHYNAFCSITWQTCMYLRTWQQNVTPIMQPFTVQPQLPSASKIPYKYVQTNNHSLQNREQEPIRRLLVFCNGWLLICAWSHGVLEAVVADRIGMAV